MHGPSEPARSTSPENLLERQTEAPSAELRNQMLWGYDGLPES